MRDAVQVEKTVLTPDLLEILEMVADGKRYSDIAQMKGGSAHMVKQKGSRAVNALNAESLPHAIAMAFREGLLK
jgi:LuxR family transcriptional regulator, activator of conjugal transfer of Ti plasmids